MTLRIILATGLLAAGAAATPAFAQHAGNAFVAAYDADKNGSLTRTEYDAGRDARFKATDADGDGTITEAEYVAEYSDRLERELASFDRGEEKKAEARQRQIRQTRVRFGVIDTSKDGKIDRAEYDAIAERSFAEQDADKDGTITAADVAATAARRTAQREQREKSEQ
ncbi:hypothetical protein [Sphingomonas sanxanigenens]|uniref:EF-hand domain-containing protein n=1 Tax=Sphingomonas sanxanigenens DSM 19645 = NX02 TaxID=1123269 RepID=W0A5X9_9SPHN|nr:hypothetical protein [Sphingomonas sanxanigenens]AHE53369.1 hypothetical protein NX02_08225 [Sphingomonas sanxanigenens DSM 19645 = NX02]